LSLPGKPFKINKTPINVRLNQLDADPVTHINNFEPLDQPSLQRWVKETHPGTLGGRAGDQGLEMLPDPRFEDQGGGRFPNLSLHFSGGIFCLGAVPGQFLQVLRVIGTRVSGQSRLKQSLGNQIRITAVRGGGMGIIPDRQPEVARSGLPRKLGNVFPCPQQLDNGE
jgi:hypothetical protein